MEIKLKNMKYMERKIEKWRKNEKKRQEMKIEWKKYEIYWAKNWKMKEKWEKKTRNGNKIKKYEIYIIYKNLKMKEKWEIKTRNENKMKKYGIYGVKNWKMKEKCLKKTRN